MLRLTWVRTLFVRRLGYVLGTAAGVAIAVALLASIGAFLAGSKASMTRRAVQNVTVDWQVETQPGADVSKVLTALQPRVRTALPVEFGQTTGLDATTGGSTQNTGPGVVLGLPPRYQTTFPGVMRRLVGTTDGVMVTQQTAANLHVAPGDTIMIGRAGLTPAAVRVAGIVELPQADSLFQKVGAPVGSQPKAPPDNIVLLPQSTWHTIFDPLAGPRPDQIQHQIHARLSHALPTDPAAAYSTVTGAARNFEATTAGAARVGDNLGATLSAARSDALYAQILFLFLGIPGVVLAALLTGTVAATGAQRRRREQALMRTRGATRRTLTQLAFLEALLIGVLGAAAGIAASFVVGNLALNSATFGATRGAVIPWLTAAAVAGLTIAIAVLVLPAWRDARRLTVVGARQVVGRAQAPHWLRFGVDFIILGAALIVFWLTSRNGYQLVLAPEGTPAISVSYWALAGPALLWLGAGLLAWRLAFMFLGIGGRLPTLIARPFSGLLASTVGATMRRQRRLLAGTLALVALSIAFAGSTAVFNSTYKAQAEVDARLTNGGDVTVTEPPGSNIGPAAGTRLASINGVRGVEPVQHRFAYVGADLQDLYGVRPETIVAATRLQDAYFQGGSAQSLIARLAQQPDGALLSAETVKDFQLKLGDTVRLRLQDGRTRTLTEVPFRYVGIAKEFPTAPRDSFILANQKYVAQKTGSNAIGAFLIDTSGSSPASVAQRVRAQVGTAATITDISTTRKVVGSSLTAVDLSGLTKVELGFAIVLAAAATGLVLALGFVERRRTFSIVIALGARPRQVGGFVWSEAVFVTIGGIIAGGIAGWALAAMLVKVLTGVFDPPPAALSVPWSYLAAVALATLVAVTIAAVTTIRRAGNDPTTVLREL